MVSGWVDDLDELRGALSRITQENNIDEIKFVEITRYGSRHYQAGLGAVVHLITHYSRFNRLRVDVMTWDTTDSRHAIPGRNDVENLGRLYYHLLKDLIQRWPEGDWRIVIDGNERVQFTALRDSINYNISHADPNMLPELITSLRELEELEVIKDISEAESTEENLVQLADLFAGIARYSHEKGAQCCNWLAHNGNPAQLRLMDVTDVEAGLECSRSEKCRFRLIDEMLRLCQRYRLGVSLRTQQHLWTPNPRKPINFWHYTPQGEYDRAPTG